MMRCFILPLVTLLFASVSAFAQGVPIQAGAVTPRHAPMYVGPPSVNPGAQVVIGDSGPAGGGGIGLGLSELLLTVPQAGSQTGPWANSGTGPYGANVCDYDNWTTGQYHYFCFSPNAQGGALIAVGAGGGASNLPFNLIVNGITYPFPGALSGITIGTTPITGGSNGSCLTVNGSVVGQAACGTTSITALTGDVTAVGPGSVAATLATVNPNVGTFGTGALIPQITVNGKGLITAVAAVTITAPANALTGSILAPNVSQSSLTSVSALNSGSLASGFTIVGPALGGTGINNGISTISIGGNVAFSGAFTFAGTLTNNTAVTFPTSGTLATVGNANVASVSNSDSTLTISPTTGAVVASIALGHANTWTATQTFPAGSITNTELANTTITVNSVGCTLGGTCSVTATATSLTSGTTGVLSAGNGSVLFNNAGTLSDSNIAGFLIGGTGITVTPGATSSATLSLSSQSNNTILANISGGSAAPTANNAAAIGSSWVLISSQTASSSASLQFTSGITSTYQEYVFVLNNVVAASASQILEMQVSENAGGSWIATGYHWASTYQDDGSATPAGFVSTTGTYLNPLIALDLSTASRGGGNGMVFLSNPASSSAAKHFHWNSSTYNGSNIYSVRGAGAYLGDVNAINGVQFIFSSGNIASGTISLYGIRYQ